MIKRIDAVASRYAAIDKKVAKARRSCFKSELYVKNKLSKKPVMAVDTVKNILENRGEFFHFSMKQNYPKNVVEMSLLGTCYVVNPKDRSKDGYQTLQYREVPVTASVSTYAKTVNEMYDTEIEEMKSPRVYKEPSVIEKVKSFFGLD